MDKIVKQMGFENLIEFNRLVSGVDISTPEKLENFKRWQVEDGTKVGLLRLPPYNLEGNPK